MAGWVRAWVVIGNAFIMAAGRRPLCFTAVV